MVTVGEVHNVTTDNSRFEENVCPKKAFMPNKARFLNALM